MAAAPVLRGTLAVGRRPRLGGVLPFVILLAACDLPTELPRWDTTWLVPAQTTTIGAANILPGGIAATPDGDAFDLAVAPIYGFRTLGQMCGTTCLALNGQTAPKPPFTGTLSSSIELPRDIISAAIRSGQIQIRLTHNFGFDPIRPGSSSRGVVLIRAVSGGTVIARDSVAGDDLAFPAGSELARTLSLPAVTLSGPLVVQVEIRSPVGDLVQVNTTQALSVAAAPRNLRIAEAQVAVSNRAITASESELDLERFDTAITERIRSGALVLDLQNPFSVSGPLELKITTPGAVLLRQLPLQAGESSARLEFEANELREILRSRPVTLNVAGTVSAPPGGTTVLPEHAVTIRSRLEVILGTKEN